MEAGVGHHNGDVEQVPQECPQEGGQQQHQEQPFLLPAQGKSQQNKLCDGGSLILHGPGGWGSSPLTEQGEIMLRRVFSVQNPLAVHEKNMNIKCANPN